MHYSRSLRRSDEKHPELSHGRQRLGWHRIQLLRRWHWRDLWRSRLEPTRCSLSWIQLPVDWFLLPRNSHISLANSCRLECRSSLHHLRPWLGTSQHHLQTPGSSSRHGHRVPGWRSLQCYPHLATLVLDQSSDSTSLSLSTNFPIYLILLLILTLGDVDMPKLVALRPYLSYRDSSERFDQANSCWLILKFATNIWLKCDHWTCS